MSNNNFTTFTIQCQDFICENSEQYEENKRILHFHSTKRTADVRCPHCDGSVIGHGMTKTKLYDLPYTPGYPTIYEVCQHRYECKKCGATFTEENPFRCPHFNLTKRCVEWICQLLWYQIPTATIAQFMGIHWNTVRKIQKARMDYCLRKEDEKRLSSSYRPYYLAVDEFAIHKGHRYATCVMDLVRGDVLWVGKGRAMKDFVKFFEHFASNDYLSEVKAVAMDMNASYNRLVEENLPNAQIVYDRFHVQSQFGRDVLGQVRLAEAKRHQVAAKDLLHENATKEQIRAEKRLYTQVKKSRWTLLRNREKLSDERKKSLNEILESHSDLSVCYAMKEELTELFKITDESTAKTRWDKWFDAAIHSGIKPLEKFGKQKQKRLDGLIAHAQFQINTGKLEGFNNKIKVAKRNAYGYRNLDYFFSYIRFLSVRSFSKNT